jgi:hypothetical protein
MLLILSSLGRYDLFAINIASTMLGLVYDPTGRNTQLSIVQDLGIKVAPLCGTLIGQPFFGWLADIGKQKISCHPKIFPDYCFKWDESGCVGAPRT